MNTAAMELPDRRPLLRDRIRGLYSGFGYVVMVSMLMDFWGSLGIAFPRLASGSLWGFLHDFGLSAWYSALAMIPGPFVIPVAVNLAPQAGPRRLLWLLAAAAPMGWWCLHVIAGINFGVNLRSAGYTLDGLLTCGMIVGLCAYHSYSRTATDVLMRTQIERASLDAELQRAKLQLLRAQIEPHFLFNTLSVLRALARNDRAATIAMLDHLMRYFEAALPRLRDGQVPLMREMELVEAYLAIYRARLGPRLAYQVALPEDLQQVQVPPMMLLTLVENALKHGISPSVEGGFIRVSAASEGDLLLLKVADSGRGLDARHGHGTGLANIRQRLLLAYGPRAVLSLKPAEPRGVVVCIAMPAL